jgi:hypothetical protein
MKPKSRIVLALVVACLAWPMLAGAAPRIGGIALPPRAERPDKPTGPILVEHRLAARPAVGVPVKIAVTARVEGDVGRLSIEASATAPRAALVSPPALVAADAGEGIYSWEITVVPLAADAGYLSVIVAGSIDGVAQARSVTIALNGAVPAEALPVTVDDGETLIALPVQESP